MKLPHPPIEFLRRSFWVAGDGEVWWLERPKGDFASERAWKIWRTKHEGRRADSLRVDGYRTVTIRFEERQHHILAHRLVWAFHHGDWPKGVIDHRDMVRGNNRIENLREATRSQNGQNSWPRGTWWDAKRGKFSAQIMVNRKTIHLGRFDTVEEAKAAYLAAKGKFHPFGPNA